MPGAPHRALAPWRRTVLIRHWLSRVIWAVVLVLSWLGPTHAEAAHPAPFRIIVTETETPLVPNSVIELAAQLGYYKRAGVDVELIRVHQTPSAVAALNSGQGDMANISFDTAVQLVARNQMHLKGVISPDPTLPYVIVAKREIDTPAALGGRVLGIARIGSLDYILSRGVLAKLGVDVDRLRYLGIGQPEVRAQSLLAGRIDATTMSVGMWTSLPDKSPLRLLVDQPAYYKAAPFISKLNVVTDEVARVKADQIRAVIRAILLASRDFQRNPQLWIEAMRVARPDVKLADLQAMAKLYRSTWSVDGGLDLHQAQLTTDALYQGPDYEGLRPVAPGEWIDRSALDAVLAEIGTAPADPP